MAFGVYFHIPYCLQRCTYCDFATYERSKIMPTEDYVQLVQTEIKTRCASLSSQVVDTIYFGGGTPSLLRPDQIVSLIRSLENEGLRWGPDCEITVEINPATVSPAQLEELIDAGVSRFSVGAQTFDDALLKSVHREHSAQQTRDTFALLQSRKINFSGDLLFALPDQSIQTLENDIKELLSFEPTHVSPYCLTVPEGHVLSKNRPLDEVQLDMFKLIDRKLRESGYRRYEVSNYAKPGFESRHNTIYWSDESFLGLGLSAHSYMKSSDPENAPFGVRFWNASSIGSYAEQVRAEANNRWPHPFSGLPENQFERLKPHEALTDFCHTSLRRSSGLSLDLLEKKFGAIGVALSHGPLAQLCDDGLLSPTEKGFRLSEEGVFISNSAFRELTFLEDEWQSATTKSLRPRT